MANQRSKLNYFIFHLSNPILVLIRNMILKIVVNNKKFLNKYNDVFMPSFTKKIIKKVKKVYI